MDNYVFLLRTLFLIIFYTSINGCTSIPFEEEEKKELFTTYNSYAKPFMYDCKKESFSYYPKVIVTTHTKANDYTSTKKSDAMNRFSKSVAKSYTKHTDVNATDRNSHYSECMRIKLETTQLQKDLNLITDKYKNLRVDLKLNQEPKSNTEKVNARPKSAKIVEKTTPDTPFIQPENDMSILESLYAFKYIALPVRQGRMAKMFSRCAALKSSLRNYKITEKMTTNIDLLLTYSTISFLSQSKRDGLKREFKDAAAKSALVVSKYKAIYTEKFKTEKPLPLSSSYDFIEGEIGACNLLYNTFRKKMTKLK